MNNTKDLLITSFALFSLFFGAGNLLLPPLLGYNAGEDWFWVTLGFVITAVAIPIIGIYAHAKLQGTLYDFGKKVSPLFSLVYCILIYVIAVAIPSPRTAAATHEIAIHPNFGTSPLLTSSIYFALVLVFALNRSKILDVIGKYLTPFIVLILLLVIGIGLFNAQMDISNSSFDTPIVDGILEGYQTFDAIAAVVVGAVIIISINIKSNQSFEYKKDLIKKSGVIAGLGLFVIYAGLIAVGAFYGSEIELNSGLSNDVQRADLLIGISSKALGSFGYSILSVLIALACFTTAVGIVTGAADYFKGLLHNSQTVYVITAVLASVFGVIVGQLDFNDIIVIALPVLLFIYPITIVLIILNAMPDKYTSSLVFKVVVLLTFLFSITDVLGFLSPSDTLSIIVDYIPFAKHSLGWVLPACIGLILTNLKTQKS
ncbi:branched-chain amino acid transport system II carrier protein [Olleya sp. YSTF-M6]|uniref:Branched-chain amino acid transport system II carrier protein n=1 Tax=Olleya sediminilitoris TaxID=2795739 RepID=A0ABS1WNI0_9FLAO|nr:branched-chain amino acid transport system II carrier protein [Olleya sediminilitoris]MBL7560660.1 branched-chain amino acid transport system II carrier protein [Olleya sediminilitoris]